MPRHDDPTIQQLLDSRPDTTRARASLGRLTELQFLPSATADSIFGVLGYPINPIELGMTQNPSALAEYDPMTREIIFNMDRALYDAESAIVEGFASGAITPRGRFDAAVEYFRQGRIPRTIAHELTHQATVNEEGEFDVQDNQILGLLNAFLNRYEGQSPDRRALMFSEYLGRSDEAARRAFRDTEPQRQEIFAKTVERGYEIARQFDPENPSKISDLIEDADETLPGVREATNFWIRSFMGLP